MTEKQSRKQTTTYANLQNDQSGQPQQGKPRKPSLHARWKTMSQAMGMEIREHKSSFAVYVVLRMLVLAMAILQFFNGNYENVFLCILTLLLLLAPAFIQVQFRIELPSVLEVIVLVFAFSAEILGEISSFYEIFPFWDTVLHTMNGFLAAAIGFSLVDLLNRSDRVKFKLSPLYLAIVSFCFSMTIGVIWEFFEFGMDQLFGFDMQKDAIVHSISSVMLDPTHTNHAIHKRHHTGYSQRPESGPRRLSRYRPDRHDGRSHRQLHRRGRVLRVRLLVCEKPRQKGLHHQPVRAASQVRRPRLSATGDRWRESN